MRKATLDSYLEFCKNFPDTKNSTRSYDDFTGADFSDFSILMDLYHFKHISVLLYHVNYVIKHVLDQTNRSIGKFILVLLSFMPFVLVDNKFFKILGAHQVSRHH